MRRRFFLAALLSFGLVGPAAAHTIWVEREGDGARIYFGEFDENLREGSPGLLDRLKPEAKVAGSDKALKVDKTAGFFAVAGPVDKDNSIVAENIAAKASPARYRCAHPVCWQTRRTASSLLSRSWLDLGTASIRLPDSARISGANSSRSA